MHAQNAEFYKKYKKCRAYEIAFELKQQGKVKHVGISFHDEPQVLDMILSENPQIEVVQIQFNYLDFDNPSVKARECYEVCCKHNKPVIVMEPVKGGRLVNIPENAKKLFAEHSSNSLASYAIRYAAGFKNVVMVLSGMSDVQQMADNLSFMENFVPFSKEEYDLVDAATKIINQQENIPCTKCEYCLSACPKGIKIPSIFACVNEKLAGNGLEAKEMYLQSSMEAKASDCIKCGKCESACPQFLDIRKFLIRAVKEFEQ